MSNYYDKINRYLEGEMEDSERESFELQLQKDSKLAAEVKLLQEAKSRISQQLSVQDELELFKQNLDSVITTSSEAKIRRLPGKRTWLAIAGIAAAIALILVLWFPRSTELYPQYAAHPQANLTDRSNELPQLTQQIESAFNNQNYQEALPLLTAFLEQNPGDSEALLFQGICFLETKAYNQAIANFTLLHEGASANKFLGTWYLALSYLAMAEQQGQGNALETCKAYLRQIPPGADNYQRARELLEKVE